MRMRLVKQFDFEAAHFLPTFPEGHKCRRMHGHSFRVEVVVEGEIDPAEGYLVDYGVLKSAIEPVRARVDHYVLNEIEGLENPTSEMIAVWMWEQLSPTIPLLAEIIVHETCSSRCHYFGPS